MRILLKAFCKIIAVSFKSLKSPMKTLSRKSEAEIFLGSWDRHLLWQQLPRGPWRGRLKRHLCEGYVSENHKGEEEGRGGGGGGRLSSAAAPHGALRQLLDEKQTPRGICHAPHTGGGPRMGGSGKPAVWLVFIFTYLVFSAVAAAALLSFCLPWRARKLG